MRYQMITLLVESNSETSDRLARTLSAIVPAVIEGVLKDAFVFNTDSSDDVARITEAAGAISMEGADLQSAVAAARADWLLCLEPGARLYGDWTEIVVDTLAETDTRRASPMRFRPEPARFSVRNLLRRPRALRSGLIILKTQAEASGAESLEALARGRATRQIAARILPAD